MADEYPAEHAATSTPAAVVPSKFYDTLKFVAQILLPGVGTFYFSFAALWNLPNATSVVGTITAVDVFLGLVLAYMKAKYDAVVPPLVELSKPVESETPPLTADGTLTLKSTEGGSGTWSLNLDGDIPLAQDYVTLKVQK